MLVLLEQQYCIHYDRLLVQLLSVDILVTVLAVAIVVSGRRPVMSDPGQVLSARQPQTYRPGMKRGTIRTLHESK